MGVARAAAVLANAIERLEKFQRMAARREISQAPRMRSESRGTPIDIVAFARGGVRRITIAMPEGQRHQSWPL